MSTAHPTEKHEAQLDRHEKQLENHEARLQELEQQYAANEVRLKHFYEDIGAIKALIANIDAKIDRLFTSLDQRVARLEQRDAQKWQKLVGVITAAAATGIMGYLLRGLLP